ncbi:hypothetical protein EZJ19_10115 [Parasulfuritortus cantonensis]|uniref:Sulfotransferase family protein n=1 Tax=Parasulfuritortus cantonensis TaxID=2528202 RepID=A0A4R1B9C8_9PROT|nr:hypothetical protein [Parasulfuritortus cantonensis]TCJ13503.1 hypothetical protein EZJ19_10115 [Parasulfuritortus cantonensis]
MNVFILNSGRCGSTTFIRACGHIVNYSAGHETRLRLVGDDRLAYPDDHIEADNRLAWLLGRLDRRYGAGAFYVHLTRAPEAVVASFARRTGMGIMKAYRDGILLGGEAGQSAEALARDYLDTVEANIALFLRDKPNRMAFRLETAQQDFSEFWRRIGARGDLAAALAEWQTRYNASAD